MPTLAGRVGHGPGVRGGVDVVTVSFRRRVHWTTATWQVARGQIVHGVLVHGIFVSVAAVAAHEGSAGWGLPLLVKGEPDGCRAERKEQEHDEND